MRAVRRAAAGRAGILLLAAWLFLSPGPARAWNTGSGVYFKIGADGFRPTASSMKSRYGDFWGGGGEIGVRLWKSVDLWLAGHYAEKSGALPVTGEGSKIVLTSIGGGLRLRLPAGPACFYAGGGPLFLVYKETNSIGLARGTKPGFVALAGVSLRLLGGLFLDVDAEYSSVVVKPKTIQADLGGLTLGLRLGFLF